MSIIRCPYSVWVWIRQVKVSGVEVVVRQDRRFLSLVSFSRMQFWLPLRSKYEICIDFYRTGPGLCLSGLSGSIPLSYSSSTVLSSQFVRFIEVQTFSFKSGRSLPSTCPPSVRPLSWSVDSDYGSSVFIGDSIPILWEYCTYRRRQVFPFHFLLRLSLMLRLQIRNMMNQGP